MRGLELFVIVMIYGNNDVISVNFEVFNCVNIADDSNK